MQFLQILFLISFTFIWIMDGPHMIAAIVASIIFGLCIAFVVIMRYLHYGKLP